MKTFWSRALIVLSFLGITLQALPAAAEETGTKVSIRLVESAGKLPEPHRLVSSLMAVDSGEKQVKVLRQRTEGQEEVTLELWGKTVPHADIPSTLRESFPVLATADIQVTELPASSRPKFEDRDLPGESDGKRKVIKKIIIQKEQE